MASMVSTDQDALALPLINGVHVDFSSWPTPDEGALQGDLRARYFSRKKAVQLFLAGASESVIKAAGSIGAKQAYRLVRERCLAPHSDGLVYGWRGLIPYLRIQSYHRRKKIRVDKFGLGAAGAMQTLLDLYPELRRKFEKRILSSHPVDKLSETKKTRISHSRWFLTELRQLGCEQRNEWPFNTLNLGYMSVCRFVDSVLKAHPRAAALLIGGPDLAKKLSSGDGVDRPINRFMQRVEMDAHKLDGRFCISIPMMNGGHKDKIIHRLWVVVIIEIVSRVVLGYYFSLRKEVSKDDVLRAIKASLTRWKRRDISFSEIPYRDDAGFLSNIDDNYIGLCWDEISVDGALAETCISVKSEIRDVVHANLVEPNNSFSKRRSKDDRPFIESFFRTLASRGFQRLTNTTGAKPSDKKGRNPDAVALTSSFQYEYAEELLDVLIANYNATPHSGIGHRSPLAYAQFCLARDPTTFRNADAGAVQAIMSLRKLCMVKGGAASGRAPFVNFYGARYTNDLLRSRFDLVGKKIWIINHLENDARVVQASTQDGKLLGVLRAAPPWHASPHSLAIRTAINSAVVGGKLILPPGADGVETFIQYVEAQPNDKLPVHVAYIEARRIMVEAAERAVGCSMLESARQRALDAAVKPPSLPLSSTTITPSPTKSSSPRRALPPLRMTASK